MGILAAKPQCSAMLGKGCATAFPDHPDVAGQNCCLLAAWLQNCPRGSTAAQPGSTAKHGSTPQERTTLMPPFRVAVTDKVT